MDVDEALRIVNRVAAADEGCMMVVAIDTAQALADRVRATADRDQWKDTAESRQALLDEHGRAVVALRRERDEARLWQQRGASEVAFLRSERNTAREKLDAWAKSLSSLLGVDPATEDVMAALSDELASWRRQTEAATAECDRAQGAWSDLMEFIRSALNLDVRALDDPGEVRKILGRVFADARLWARVKELAAGNFRAGDVVTADALNAFSEAVKDGAARHTTRIVDGAVWSAPYGTDPADWHKWTRIGTARDFTVEMTVDRPKLTDLMTPETAAVFAGPARQHFSVGAPEPAARVTRVTRPQHSAAGAVFVRVGVLSDGKSVWRREGDDAALLRWAEIVRYQAAVEA